MTLTNGRLKGVRGLSSQAFTFLFVIMPLDFFLSALTVCILPFIRNPLYKVFSCVESESFYPREVISTCIAIETILIPI